MQNDLIARHTLLITMQRQGYRKIDGVEYIRRDAVLEKIKMAPHVEPVEVKTNDKS